MINSYTYSYIIKYWAEGLGDRNFPNRLAIAILVKFGAQIVTYSGPNRLAIAILIKFGAQSKTTYARTDGQTPRICRFTKPYKKPPVFGSNETWLLTYIHGGRKKRATFGRK